MRRLDGKVAVVTGGANGIGRSCCVAFAREGARVMVGDVASRLGADTVGQIESLGGQAGFVLTDVAERGQVDALIGEAMNRYGQIDVLVTAAGVPHSAYETGGPAVAVPVRLGEERPAAQLAEGFLSVPDSEFQGVLDVNLRGTLFAMQAAGREMVRQGAGSMVTISSIAAKVPFGVSYSVSKAGVWMLTKVAAKALGPSAVRVNSIGPGYIDTSMTTQMMDVEDASWHAFLRRELAMGRMGTPDEIAEVALFLASDEASYMTGQLLHPDGGAFTG